MLVVKFNSEIEAVNQTLSDWEKARTINASPEAVPNNNELTDKINHLERGKAELEKFIKGLDLKLRTQDAEFRRIEDELANDRVHYTMIFNAATALYSHKYTIGQKNEINKRITAVNSSRMLNNSDMLSLQQQWSSLLGMKNDRRLEALRAAFEGRLSDWENLIIKKKNLTL